MPGHADSAHVHALIPFSPELVRLSDELIELVKPKYGPSQTLSAGFFLAGSWLNVGLGGREAARTLPEELLELLTPIAQTRARRIARPAKSGKSPSTVGLEVKVEIPLTPGSLRMSVELIELLKPEYELSEMLVAACILVGARLKQDLDKTEPHRVGTTKKPRRSVRSRHAAAFDCTAQRLANFRVNFDESHQDQLGGYHPAVWEALAHVIANPIAWNTGARGVREPRTVLDGDGRWIDAPTDGPGASPALEIDRLLKPLESKHYSSRAVAVGLLLVAGRAMQDYLLSLPLPSRRVRY